MDQLSTCIIKAADAEFYQCVSSGNVLTYKHAPLNMTNILIKVEKLIKYDTAVAEKYELIHSHRDLSLSMIEV